MNMKVKIIYVFIILMVQNACAIEDKDIRWSEGNSYRVTPTDNMLTEIDYTIKIVDFPSPVRGVRTINGTVPERSVIPFVTLEIYKDIINNSNPIDILSLGIGDEYITEDKELKIILDDMPGDMSQDWVYEYYNPWANIKIQKRALPNLDISITLKDEEEIEEDNIKPGDMFKIEVKIRNTGEDILKNIEFRVVDTSLLMIPKESKYYIYRLDKDEEKIEKIEVVAPTFLEEKEYEIYVNVTGYDIKQVSYSWNASKTIKVKGDLELIYVNKTVSRPSIYLRENAFVILSIVNRGLLPMNNITIYDSIPDDLLFLDNKNISMGKFSFHKDSIGPSDSWILKYSLKPLEPGIYILPRFKASYFIGGRYFELFSEEAGFRVFGPIVALNKSANKKDGFGYDIVEVTVSAKNIGNGFTRIIIEDELPEGATLISGRLNMTTYLDPGIEKIMNYTIKISRNVTSWPPARATYYLDDYKFNITSNEKVEGIKVHTIPIEKGEEEKGEKEEKGEGDKGEKEEKGEKGEEVAEGVTTTLPEVEASQKRVVATIPAKTPAQVSGIPGFRFYELLVVTVLILLKSIKRR